jgi:tripartite-type tricarboxylate transporter receptor subunit TctC
MIYGSGPVVMPHMSSGKLRAIAVTTEKRSRALPSIPTIAESGVPGYDSITWYGLMGPRGLPKPVVARWQTIMSEALQSREMKERFDADGLEMPERLFRARAETRYRQVDEGRQGREHQVGELTRAPFGARCIRSVERS